LLSRMPAGRQGDVARMCRIGKGGRTATGLAFDESIVGIQSVGADDRGAVAIRRPAAGARNGVAECAVDAVLHVATAAAEEQTGGVTAPSTVVPFGLHESE